MSALWQSAATLFDQALHGLSAPWLVMTALMLTTFLLEDLAIAAGAALAAQGLLSWPLAFVAVAGGIALGDIGLYAVGRAARRLPFLQRRYITAGKPWLQNKLNDRLGSALLLARAIPGLRLLTYTLCGFAAVSILPFTAWVLLAVTLWTAALFWLSSTVGAALAASLHIPVALAVALPIVLLALTMQVMRSVGPHSLRSHL